MNVFIIPSEVKSMNVFMWNYWSWPLWQQVGAYLFLGLVCSFGMVKLFEDRELGWAVLFLWPLIPAGLIVWGIFLACVQLDKYFWKLSGKKKRKKIKKEDDDD